MLDKSFVRKGKSYVVTLGDKECDVEIDTFQLFITSRMPNPHFTPELSAKVTVVDFTVTMAGLEDQLLGKLISKEKKELEDQRQQLLEEVQSYKKRIKQLEDDLLFRLSNSQGNLLDDTELIDVLAVTKQTAQVRAREPARMGAPGAGPAQGPVLANVRVSRAPARFSPRFGPTP